MGQQNDNGDNENKSDSDSDSDSSSLGVPGGGPILTFLPVTQQNDDEKIKNDSASSSSSSSSSSPIGIPGGGTDLSFLPVNDNNENNDEEASSSSSDDESIGLPGGGDQLSFLPVNPDKYTGDINGHWSDHQKKKSIQINNNSEYKDEGMNMLSSYNEDEQEGNLLHNNQLSRIESGIAIDFASNSYHAASYSNDDVEVSPSPHPSQPRMSTSKTATNH